MSVTPFVMVEDAKRYAEFLKSTFDAEVRTLMPLKSNPEKVVQAEAKIGSATIFFADSGPTGAFCQRTPAEPPPIQLWAEVPDAAATYQRAVAAGATPCQEVVDSGNGGKVGGFIDPFRYLWWVNTAA